MKMDTIEYSQVVPENKNIELKDMATDTMSKNTKIFVDRYCSPINELKPDCKIALVPQSAPEQKDSRIK